MAGMAIKPFNGANRGQECDKGQGWAETAQSGF